MRFSVSVSESGNGPYAEIVRAGRHMVEADEPESLGGRDAGMAPYEYLMAGLGACTAMTLRAYAARHQWPLGKITVLLHHEKATSPDGKNKIDRFEREILIPGDLTDGQRATLLAVAEGCPVSQTLQRPSIVLSQIATDGPSVAAQPDAV